MAGATTDYTGTDFTVTTGLTPGATYQFQVRAKNIWGYGDFSSIIYVEASDVPAAPDTVTSYVDSTTGSVVVSWLEPDDGSNSIDAYLIEIEDEAASAWNSYTTTCDGSLTSILTSRQCTISMTVFDSAPYTYTTVGSVIPFRVSAHNDNGWGATSTPNTAGASYKTIPTTMAQPSRGSATSET